MKFHEWLARQRERHDPIGDLARDAKDDSGWPPDTHTLSGFKSYLYDQSACREAQEALSEAWCEWKRL